MNRFDLPDATCSALEPPHPLMQRTRPGAGAHRVRISVQNENRSRPYYVVDNRGMANKTVQELLDEWYRRVQGTRKAHYAAAEWFHRLSYWLGVPTVVLSLFVGTSVFASLKTNPSLYFKSSWVDALCSLRCWPVSRLFWDLATGPPSIKLLVLDIRPSEERWICSESVHSLSTIKPWMPFESKWIRLPQSRHYSPSAFASQRGSFQGRGRGIFTVSSPILRQCRLAE